MTSFFSELASAFHYALDSDPLYVLLPLVVVAVAEGVQSDGIFEVFNRAFRGLVWLMLAVFAFGGLVGAGRFSPEAWGTRLDAGLDELLTIRMVEVLGFYLLLLAGIALIFLVRQVVRR